MLSASSLFGDLGQNGVLFRESFGRRDFSNKLNEATVLTNHQENYEIRLVGVYWLVENYVIISCNKILKMHLVNGKNPRKHCQFKRKQNTQ